VKAITLWQPWATLIAVGAKPFETRTWATSYRGPLAIHAAKTDKGLKLCGGVPEIENALTARGLSLDLVPLGVVVCTTRLVEVLSAEAILRQGLADAFGDYSPGRYAWRLVDVRPVDPPPRAVGGQGLWEWGG
jgi:hypothetical protein